MESPSQDKLLLIRQCFARLTAQCTLTFAHSFAGLSRKYPSADPSNQQGAHERKGPWCLALAKPHFWKLGCCIWNLFLETQHAMLGVPAAGARMCFKTMVFGSPSEAWLLPMVPYHSPAGPRAAGGGSP